MRRIRVWGFLEKLPCGLLARTEEAAVLSGNAAELKFVVFGGSSWLLLRDLDPTDTQNPADPIPQP